MKNCDLGHENVALGHSFTIRTSQPANNIYMYLFQNCFSGVKFCAKCEVFLQKQFLSVVAIEGVSVKCGPDGGKSQFNDKVA